MAGEEGKDEIKVSTLLVCCCIAVVMLLFTVKAAVVTMTEVGDRINEVKKKYEATVKIQVCTYIRTYVCAYMCV